MRTYSARLTIIAGRQLDRQVIKVARNVPADGPREAQEQIQAWARELGLGSFMDQDDVRLTYSVSLGAEAGLS
jgi:hypothetical protein